MAYQSYVHFVEQDSFNLAAIFEQLRTRLLNYEENRKHKESVDNVHSHSAVTSKKARPKHMSSIK